MDLITTQPDTIIDKEMARTLPQNLDLIDEEDITNPILFHILWIKHEQKIKMMAVIE